MTRRLRSLRLIAAAALATGGLMTLPSSSVADDNGPVPGLPAIPCPPVGDGFPEGTDNSCRAQPDPDDYANNGSWLNFPQVGVVGSLPAKQWARVPLSMMSASVIFNYYNHPTEQVPGEKTTTEYWYDIKAFFVSPKGSKNPYGESALVPVRTVAFGSIPVEATLQVEQERDAGGDPVPLAFQPHDYTIYRGTPSVDVTKVVEKAEMQGKVIIKVKSLTVDGVDIGLGSVCRTGSYAKIRLSSPRVSSDQEPGYEGTYGRFEDIEFDPTKQQYGIQGGTLTGQIDIPGFTGCSTKTGDDLSPLLTSAISADGNPLMVRIGATNCVVYDFWDGGGDDPDNPDYSKYGSRPIPAGVNDPSDPRAGCTTSTHPNPKIVTVPEPFDFPDYAPGEQPAP
jgi:hypothetical protein